MKDLLMNLVLDMILLPICNILYLLFITTLQLSESKETKFKRNTKEPFMSHYYQSMKYDPLQFPSGHRYKVRLYSKASAFHLRILGRRQIDSLGTMHSADSILIIETVAFGVIRIRGEMSGLYLCMNRRGHLVARRKNLKSSRCAFIVEDDHPKAYKRYVSLAFGSYRIAFNKNGRPRTASRVPNREHRSVLFVERKLNRVPPSYSMRTRRHGRREEMQNPCKEQNRTLLAKEWLKFWTLYCAKRQNKKLKVSRDTDR